MGVSCLALPLALAPGFRKPCTSPQKCWRGRTEQGSLCAGRHKE
ncbi:hypothetical protein I603_2500 [Erythrobacter dokdonensis DSW-74]|uniref:Uncharacterized protein n=1 Tax=Erythrobacter dokdonensis DSW-74 TaxID=1300349 RepID=A0A1A7BFJ6_9SPHN|nr:hypothetical protein I603_2500 [Erythrobacter dokdonensis DSW-74]